MPEGATDRRGEGRLRELKSSINSPLDKVEAETGVLVAEFGAEMALEGAFVGDPLSSPSETPKAPTTGFNRLGGTIKESRGDSKRVYRLVLMLLSSSFYLFSFQ